MKWSSIIKTQKILYHRFHQKMLCNIDKWIDKTLEEILDDEKYFLEKQKANFYPSTVASIRP